jgi:hypothetical protein
LGFDFWVQIKKFYSLSKKPHLVSLLTLSWGLNNNRLFLENVLKNKFQSQRPSSKIWQDVLSTPPGLFSNWSFEINTWE